jgi:hypothetical protein
MDGRDRLRLAPGMGIERLAVAAVEPDADDGGGRHGGNQAGGLEAARCARGGVFLAHDQAGFILHGQGLP